MAAACHAAATAPAQRVINGEAITDDDIEQRTKFNLLAYHKGPPRKETIEELIDDKLKARIVLRYDFSLTERTTISIMPTWPSACT
jgi:hypothetical protein